MAGGHASRKKRGVKSSILSVPFCACEGRGEEGKRYFNLRGGGGEGDPPLLSFSCAWENDAIWQEGDSIFLIPSPRRRRRRREKKEKVAEEE